MTDKMPLNYKRLSDAALQARTKAELISYIRMLEHNWAAAEERCDRQYELLRKKRSEDEVC